VLSREWSTRSSRQPGELERTYLEIFDRFSLMIKEGLFPFPGKAADSSVAPRVGDGVLVIDEAARVRYASPNAVSALHRVGIGANSVGQTLAELGFTDSAVRQAFERHEPVVEEFDQTSEVTLLARCMPLLNVNHEDGSHSATGAVLLLRDVSELRRRDRLILSKDATIREIHHRVKNNLQTISGLLQLQKDTLKDEHLLAVLNEGQSRVNSIALLHQSLYQNEDLVHIDIEPFFTELARKISELFDSYQRKIALQIDMEKLLLDVDTAMPLGLILNELLTNSLKYAGIEQNKVRVHIAVKQLQEGRYELSYFDSGPGLPSGIDFTHPNTLGLRLVKGLARQIGGDIQYRYGENARFVLSFSALKNRGDA
jgi:two-component sensor histidine kinase